MRGAWQCLTGREAPGVGSAVSNISAQSIEIGSPIVAQRLSLSRISTGFEAQRRPRAGIALGCTSFVAVHPRFLAHTSIEQQKGGFMLHACFLYARARKKTHNAFREGIFNANLQSRRA